MSQQSAEPGRSEPLVKRWPIPDIPNELGVALSSESATPADLERTLVLVDRVLSLENQVAELRHRANVGAEPWVYSQIVLSAPRRRLPIRSRGEHILGSCAYLL